MADQALTDVVVTLETKAASIEGLVPSAVATMNGLAAELAAALANVPAGTDPALIARIQAVSDGLTAKASDLATAITADAPKQ